MRQTEVDKKFDWMWQETQEQTSVAYIKGVKDLCRKFFTAGMEVVMKPETEVIPQDFLDWWKIYDLQVNRKDCLRKWLKLTDEEKKACMAYTPAYVEATPEKHFRKRPLTFLNQKSWNDEIIYRNGNKHREDRQRLEKIARTIARYTGAGDEDTE